MSRLSFSNLGQDAVVGARLVLADHRPEGAGPGDTLELAVDLDRRLAPLLAAEVDHAGRAHALAPRDHRRHLVDLDDEDRGVDAVRVDVVDELLGERLVEALVVEVVLRAVVGVERTALVGGQPLAPDDADGDRIESTRGCRGRSRRRGGCWWWWQSRVPLRGGRETARWKK